MVSSQETLLQTPLYPEHIALKAKIVPFAGWEMPLQYDGILAEYQYCRNQAALFDTSHMGEFMIEGDCIQGGLDRIVTCRISDMPLKTCRYGMMLNEHGGIIDDLTVYRIAEKKWFIVINAAGIAEKAGHFRKHLTSQAVFEDISKKTGKLDLQGPLSREIFTHLVDKIGKLEYFTFDHFDLLNEKVLISRTGYTGELGYEIYFPADHLKELWKEFLKNDKVKPAGLGARDLLRLEMCYSLYGQDLNTTTTPLEAGLSRFVDFKKDFIGKEMLEAQKSSGIRQKIVCFISENRRSPRPHYKIFSEDGQKIGEVTSGIFSPSLGKGIGMGYVVGEYSTKGQKIFFGDGKNKIPGQITLRPFYKNGSFKS